MSDTTRESLVRSTLNKRSKVPKQFQSLFDKKTIPFPICEFSLNPTNNDLTHYSLHNWRAIATNVPTICIHGLNGSRLIFSDLIAVIDQFYPTLPLVTVDLFGHGLSSCPNRKYSMGIFVDQIDALLTRLGLRPDQQINLIGFSLGGAVSVGFANKYPHRINKLVLISPAGFVPFHKKGKPTTPAGPAASMAHVNADDITEQIEEEDMPTGVSSHVKLIKWIPSFIANPVARYMFKVAFEV